MRKWEFFSSSLDYSGGFVFLLIIYPLLSFQSIFLERSLHNKTSFLSNRFTSKENSLVIMNKRCLTYALLNDFGQIYTPTFVLCF